MLPFPPSSHLPGSIAFDRLDLFDVVEDENQDPFLSSWRQQGEDDVERLNGLVPTKWLKAGMCGKCSERQLSIRGGGLRVFIFLCSTYAHR